MTDDDDAFDVFMDPPKEEKKKDTAEKKPNQPATKPQNFDDERLGDEYDNLARIISEVSPTKRLRGVLRAFRNYDLDDFQQLANILSMADIPKGNIKFILNNWASHRNVEIDVDKVRIKTKKKPEDKDDDTGDDDDDPFGLGKLSEEETRNRVKDVKQRLLFLKLKKQEALLERELNVATGHTPNKQGDSDFKVIRKVRVSPKLDEEGNQIVDANGRAVVDQIVEEIPVDSSGRPLGGPTVDPMQQLAQMMALMRNFMPQQNNIETEKLRLELERLKNEKSMAEQESKFSQQIGEIKTLLKEKELVDEFGGVIGSLKKEIDGLKNSQNLNNEQYVTRLNKEIADKTLEKVTEVASGIDKTAKNVIESMVDDQVKERQFQREIYKQQLATAYGTTPQVVQQQYEARIVPDVSDEQLATSVGVKLIPTQTAVGQQPPKKKVVDDFSDLYIASPGGD